MNNPCLSCGACCAYFRVSFYWAEIESRAIDPELTLPVTPHRVAMRGTERTSPRCISLLGKVGDCVSCSIYKSRPSPCHDVMPSWHNGQSDEQCDKARIAWGLAPLQPAEPGEPPHLPDGNLPHAA